METFETSRLHADRIREEHCSLVRRMFQDERVCATLGGVLTDARCDRALRRNLDHWDQYGFGIWHFFDRQTDAFVGRAGLRHHQTDNGSSIELSYTVMPEFWNYGYATEMSARILEVGFGELRLEEVICFTWVSNLPSRRVMEKLGFGFDREGMHAELPHVFYLMTAGQFRHRSQVVPDTPG
jgi:ribosomal-protein-alanine N-acetyltransferase